ncbi:hypothetical protein ACWGDX_11395 [Streptomyces sp. NPDC055025]
MPHAARGRFSACVARETGLHVDTVRRWCGRFTQAGPAGGQRPSTPGPSRLVRTAPGRRGQGAGLAGCLPRVKSALTPVVPGTGPRGRPAGHRPVHEPG